MKIAVIDYGMGNLGSVQSALSALGCPSTIAGTAEEIAQQDALILPGVGAFRRGDRALAGSRLGRRAEGPRLEPG